MSIYLAIDLGLSALKTLFSTPDGNCLFIASVPYPTYTPKAGWVEQHPEDWINALHTALSSVPENIKNDIAAISFSGHMSSVVIVDKENKPISKCLTLTDTRGNSFISELQDLKNRAMEITGNGMGSTHWVAKVRWLLENLEHSKNARKVLFSKDYLRLYLTGDAASEYTDCGNTGMMDYSTGDWDDLAVSMSGIPNHLLPDIFCPYQEAGLLLPKPAKMLGIKSGIPVFFGGADMACGALGGGITVDGGDVAITLGSCATMLTIINPKVNKKPGIGKVSFHPYIFPKTMYALGSHYTGGLGVNWFCGLFTGNSLKPDYEEITKLAESAANIPPGSNNLLMLPFMVGSGSPHNRGTDKGAFLGMTLSTTKGAMFRSVLEGIAFNLFETEMVFEEMAGKELNINIGGGGINIKSWPEIIADVFGRNITFLPIKDVSAWGAIMIGAYGLGEIKDIYPKMNRDKQKKIMFSEKNHETYYALFKHYQESYKILSPWYKNFG